MVATCTRPCPLLRPPTTSGLQPQGRQRMSCHALWLLQGEMALVPSVLCLAM